MNARKERQGTYPKETQRTPGRVMRPVRIATHPCWCWRWRAEVPQLVQRASEKSGNPDIATNETGGGKGSVPAAVAGSP